MSQNYYIPWGKLNEFMNHIDWSVVKRAEVRPFSKDEVSIDTIKYQKQLKKTPFVGEWQP